MAIKQFTLFWKDGSRNVVEGKTLLDAVRGAGYFGGAIRALDFTADGDNQEYKFYQKAGWLKEINKKA